MQNHAKIFHEVLTHRKKMSSENNVKEPPIVEVGKKLEGTDVDYYNDAAKYWEKVDSTVNGMLGGFGKISEVDI